MTMKANKISEGSNLRWEGMRMMLPEHVQGIRQHEFDKTKVSKPNLDEQEWQEVERTINEGMGETRLLEVTYYNEGFYKTFEGFAILFDQQTKRLKMEDTAGDPDWLPIDMIVSVVINDANVMPYCDDV